MGDLFLILPTATTFALYAAAVAALALTPGPDMTLFLSRTLTYGRLQGFASMLGAHAGILLHTTLVAVGLSAVLAASPTVFAILKVVGCLYLLWLAFDAVRNGSSFTADQSTQRETSSLQAAFLKGVLINLLNPKIIVFFVTFLPQFVAASDPYAGWKLGLLGATYLVVSVPICGAIVYFASALAETLRRSPTLLRTVDWIFAGVMSGFALKLLFARTSS